MRTRYSCQLRLNTATEYILNISVHGQKTEDQPEWKKKSSVNIYLKDLSSRNERSQEKKS